MLDDEDTFEGIQLKKSSLSRQEIEKNALRKQDLAASISKRLSTSSRLGEDRPTYSIDYLNELKSSTPSTPPNLCEDPLSSTARDLDKASKVGSALVAYELRDRNPNIPGEAEIQEKKARRARLAKERKYNIRGLGEESEEEPSIEERPDSDDDEFRTHHDRISLSAPQSKYPETRLVPDDEDMMEGFDSFVSDGHINLGQKAEREAAFRHKAEMRELIENAEGSSGENSSDSGRERRDAYEAAQTRKGMEGLRVDRSSMTETESRTPPRITPIPTLAGCVTRLKGMLTKLEVERDQDVRQLSALTKEKSELDVREVELQKLLEEMGEKYKELVAETGIPPGVTGDFTMGMVRGLESLGGTPLRLANGTG